MLGTILLIVLILLLLGALPTWPHSRSWGYYPSGGLGLVLVIVVVLLLMGRYVTGASALTEYLHVGQRPELSGKGRGRAMFVVD